MVDDTVRHEQRVASKPEPFALDREQRDRILAILDDLAAQISAFPFDEKISGMQRSVTEMQAYLSAKH